MASNNNPSYETEDLEMGFVKDAVHSFENLVSPVWWAKHKRTEAYLEITRGEYKARFDRVNTTWDTLATLALEKMQGKPMESLDEEPLEF